MSLSEVNCNTELNITEQIAINNGDTPQLLKRSQIEKAIKELFEKNNPQLKTNN